MHVFLPSQPLNVPSTASASSIPADNHQPLALAQLPRHFDLSMVGNHAKSRSLHSSAITARDMGAQVIVSRASSVHAGNWPALDDKRNFSLAIAICAKCVALSRCVALRDSHYTTNQPPMA